MGKDQPLLLKTLLRKLAVWRTIHKTAPDLESAANNPDEELLSKQLAVNLTLLQHTFESSPDLVFRRFGTAFRRDAAIVFIDGLVNKEQIEQGVLRPLTAENGRNETVSFPSDLNSYIQSKVTCGKIQNTAVLAPAIDAILAGDALLLIDGAPSSFLINVKDDKKTRAISEPDREIVIKGPREGFVESLDVNIVLLRRRIKSAKLSLEIVKLGRKTRTEVCIVALKGVVGDSLITEIKQRLNRINTDAILDSGKIEELLKDAPLSPFATIAYSERPDIVAAKILEGRAALLIDGTPIALTVPMLFIERFQNPDDYNYNFYYSSLIRWLRFISYLLTVFSPALYVALISYHPELIPTPLLFTMAAAAEGTPFPAVVEAIGMGVIVEILREAGRRMPGPTGPVVTLLGLLVVGQALISSGLVGGPFVIVVTVTLGTSLLVPSQEDTNLLFRMFFVLLSGCLGLYGLMLGFAIVYIHLAGIRSFGVPYLAPLTPWNPLDAADALIRAPWWLLKRRPTLIGREDRIRQDSPIPKPPDDGQF
jgi:spore germination protein KA